MRRKKRIGLIMLEVGVLVGGGGLWLSQHVLHKTSETIQVKSQEPRGSFLYV